MARFSELDRYLFGQATHYEIYRKLGAHITEENGVRGVCFDLWAPNADKVWVIGSFNGWNETAHQMEAVSRRPWASLSFLFRVWKRERSIST